MRPSNEQIHRCWTIMAKILGKGVMYPVFAFIHGGTSFFPVILSIQPWLHQAWHCRMATFSACLRWWDGQMCFSASRNAKRQDCRDRTVLLMAHIHCSYVVLQMTKISTAYVISAMCVRVWKPQKSKHIYLVLHPVCHHPSFFRSFFVFFYHPRTAGLDEETEAIDVAANDLGILGTQGLQALPGMTTQSCKCYLGKPMEINGNP